MRNAVGVLKDVQEYWVGRNGVPARGRHHYQYAIFSTSGFTDVAQEYAFAHDIYLVPLAGSRFMNAIVESIRETTAAHFRAENSQNIAIDQAQLRQRLRDEITHDGEGQLDNLIDVPEGLAHLRAFVDNCREVNEAFISVVGDRFPLFLVPAEGVDVFRMPGADPVRIVVRDGNWFVVSQDGDRLFSFDIPPEFFELYDQWADLTPESIYTIKKRFLHSIQIIATRQGRVRVITLELDREWLRRVREGLGRVKRYKE